jgi:hypothetical protein
MRKFGDELIVSLKQAVPHAKGRKVRGMRVTTVEKLDKPKCVGDAQAIGVSAVRSSRGSV